MWAFCYTMVKEIAKANLNALEHSNANYQAINIGTGTPSP